MIAALLTSSIAALSAPQDPAPVTALPESGPGLTLVVEETRLSLASTSLEPLLLLVVGREEAPRVAAWLPCGVELETSFARGALDGLRFEVVQHVAGAWRSTGTLSFPAAGADGAEIAWVFPSGVALSASADGPITPLLAGGSVLPLSGAPWAATPAGNAAPTPLHVPVPEPSDRPEAGTPPKLEKRPLPPV